MFDYSQVDSRTFEVLAQCYLKSKYPDYEWVLTPPGNDGNKDIYCKYKVLNQNFEYWAEAKFTKSINAHTLLKGQLDPTLISALLYPKQVSICFISNNNMTESYQYRLRDFKIKTNIGIELILKEEFERWLINNPEILDEYGIKAVAIENQKEISDYQILSATITDIFNFNQYKIETHLIEKNVYYLYIILVSAVDVLNVQLKINGFISQNRSKSLDNPDDFAIKEGKNIYKFEIVPLQSANLDMKICLLKDGEILTSYILSDLTIISNMDVSLSYIKQEKYLVEISQLVLESNGHNFLIPVLGNGSTGKTKLMQYLYTELNNNNNVIMFSFSGNEYLDIKVLIQILLFFNIGNIFEYSKEALLLQLDILTSQEQKIYYVQLINGYFDSPGTCISYLNSKILSQDFPLIYPGHTNIQQVVILDDVHKISNTLLEIFRIFVTQFLKLSNNQALIIACREHYKGFSVDFDSFRKEWIKPYLLEGLTKEDKLNTLSYYFSFNGDIDFNRATDDLIVFGNILRKSLEQNKNNVADPIYRDTNLAHSFEDPQVVNNFLYKEQLHQLSEYYDVIECIYYINFGIDYIELTQYFSYEKIDFLLERKVFKRIGKKIVPFHDYYVKAYFEDNKLSNDTIHIIKKMCDESKSNDQKYLFLSLLIQSGYNVYTQVEEEAHKLEYYYFNITDYYKAYILAKAFKKYINFDEQLSYQELYDMFILAISSGFFKEASKVRKLYDDVIKYSRLLIADSSVQGTVFRAQSEVINIDYWELNLKDLADTIDKTIMQIPMISKNTPENLMCAYLNLINRKMVVQLILENYELADEIFKNDYIINKQLDRTDYIGYLYMDYSKGFYNCELRKALEYMQKAQRIFEKLGTEHRRLLDCNCEVAYLKCLRDQDQSLEELESASNALYQSQFIELYSKAKLKLAAIKIVRGGYSKEEIEHDIYISKYVLSYSFTGRLALLYKMIKNAFLIYSNRANEIEELTPEEMKKINLMGRDYQRVWDHNTKGLKKSFAFLTEHSIPYVYILDTRIW